MKSNEFYSQLSQVSNTYNWSVTGKTIVGQGVRGNAKGVTFNPITAVAYRKGYGIYISNKRETLKAGKALGLSTTFTTNLYQATTNYSNRGHSQVVRGRIKTALEI